MIPLWAKVGTKVVCVSDVRVPGFGHGTEEFPVRGVVYTIRAIISDDQSPPGLRLHEILNPPLSYADGVFEIDFHIERFRPLITASPSEDLAVFRRIADLAGVDEALRRLEGVE